MDETAINAIAEFFNRPIRFFDPDTLEKETPRLKNPSNIVFKEVGCHGVAEGSALAAAGADSELIIEKTSSKSKIIYKTHEEIFGKAFDDPKRRTPGIEKIIKFTGIEPSKNIDFMIENIINHKKTEL